MPFAWILGFLGVACFLRMGRAKGRGIRLLLWNVGMGLVIVAAVEILLGFGNRSPASGGAQVRNSSLYDVRVSGLLGYTLKPGTRRQAGKYYGDEVVYEVTYTVDEKGLRVSPPAGEKCTESLLFFGCSYTYGEGVDDEETMPYRVGAMSDGRFAVYNFGVHGYGPQHMLTLLKFGKVKNAVSVTPGHAVYQCVYPSHVYRVAGLRSWVRTGPRYVLDRDGSARYTGSFPSFWRRAGGSWIRWQLGKSSLARRLLRYTRPLNRRDRRLFLAVVRQSKQLLEDSYPGIAFHVLLWDGPEDVIQSLSSMGCVVHSVNEILDASDVSKEDLVVHRLDTHPSAIAHDLLARYLVREFLDPPQESGL